MEKSQIFPGILIPKFRKVENTSGTSERRVSAATLATSRGLKNSSEFLSKFQYFILKFNKKSIWKITDFPPEIFTKFQEVGKHFREICLGRV